ncbi:MAG: hypothetical protein DHS20C05_00910 [Hyphococcus sp.]|nr:MAG: hypothetical protein DHS20C05_00910 [Marinicaulis sp.]
MTIIQTSRLTLRSVTRDDAPDFARLCNDKTIARHTARIPHPYSLEDAAAFTKHLEEAALTGTEFAFAICLGEIMIGCCGADKNAENTAEIGYWVGADHRGIGVASEAARAITQFALQRLGVKTVTAGYFIDNPASGRVLEKIGFIKTGETAPLFSLGRGEEAAAVRMVLDQSSFTPGEFSLIDENDS